MCDDVKNALTAVGALSEIVCFLYRRLVENGLSEEQAIELCKVWLIKTL